MGGYVVCDDDKVTSSAKDQKVDLLYKSFAEDKEDKAPKKFLERLNKNPRKFVFTDELFYAAIAVTKFDLNELHNQIFLFELLEANKSFRNIFINDFLDKKYLDVKDENFKSKIIEARSQRIKKLAIDGIMHLHEKINFDIAFGYNFFVGCPKTIKQLSPQTLSTLALKNIGCATAILSDKKLSERLFNSLDYEGICYFIDTLNIEDKKIIVTHEKLGKRKQLLSKQLVNHIASNCKDNEKIDPFLIPKLNAPENTALKNQLIEKLNPFNRANVFKRVLRKLFGFLGAYQREFEQGKQLASAHFDNFNHQSAQNSPVTTPKTSSVWRKYKSDEAAPVMSAESDETFAEPNEQEEYDSAPTTPKQASSSSSSLGATPVTPKPTTLSITSTETTPVVLQRAPSIMGYPSPLPEGEKSTNSSAPITPVDVASVTDSIGTAPTTPGFYPQIEFPSPLPRSENKNEVKDIDSAPLTPVIIADTDPNSFKKIMSVTSSAPATPKSAPASPYKSVSSSQLPVHPVSSNTNKNKATVCRQLLFDADEEIKPHALLDLNTSKKLKNHSENNSNETIRDTLDRETQEFIF